MVHNNLKPVTEAYWSIITIIKYRHSACFTPRQMWWQLRPTVMKLMGGRRGGERGREGGAVAVRFAWLSSAQACLCDSRKTDKKDTALRPSLHCVPALPRSPLAFAVLPFPLFPFPSPSLLMICSACRCLADWCPLTAPLMRKGCTPPPLHTHTHTYTQHTNAE